MRITAFRPSHSFIYPLHPLSPTRCRFSLESIPAVIEGRQSHTLDISPVYYRVTVAAFPLRFFAK